MEIINSELIHLEKFSLIARVDALKKRYGAIKRVLRIKIFREFRELPMVCVIITFYL
jgi:hypothetical protein